MADLKCVVLVLQLGLVCQLTSGYRPFLLQLSCPRRQVQLCNLFHFLWKERYGAMVQAGSDSAACPALCSSPSSMSSTLLKLA
eukprot:1152954-Pelagomonas_calceolata.AAC.2